MVGTSELLASLKAAGESTRLRILMLLRECEFNVKDLTRILTQSQPRISRHLKLLVEAGLVQRFREGSWVYFRLVEPAAGEDADSAEYTSAGAVNRALLSTLDRSDPVLVRDRERAEAVKRERAQAAQAYFQDHASDWDRIRALHLAEAEVETAMRDVLGSGPFDMLVDLGTGTGRAIELFAGQARQVIGIDVNQAMLAYARAKLERAGLGHAQVRQGDLYNLPLGDARADAVILHQVLHFLDDPGRALREAARLLKPGGHILIVDFAPHDLEFLRHEFAHQRLGFSGDQMRQWLAAAGLVLRVQRDLTPVLDADASGLAQPQSQKLTVSLWLGTRPRTQDVTGLVPHAAKKSSKHRPNTAKVEVAA